MRGAVAVGVVIVLVTGALVSGAVATPADGLTRVGGVPRPPAGTRVVAPLADSTTISVTITLRPSNPAALQSYASAVSTPGSNDFRRYLSVADFRARFAPSANEIAAVRAMLVSDGLTPGPVSANGLVITLSASAAQLARAFSTSFEQVKLADGRTAYANTAAPAVPSAIASTIQSITGLNSLFVAHPLGLGRRLHRHRDRPDGRDRPAVSAPDVVTGGPQACDNGSANLSSYTADDLASAYGFSGLYGQNDFGAGETIGLLELEPYDQSDVTQYESCYDIAPSVTNIPVDGFNQTGPGQGEANNDIEDVIGLAPAASVLVYQAPNTAADLLDVLGRMVSDDQADVLSTSWGMCEANTSPGFTAAENVDLEEAAVQGQSFFAAAGDSGSADCGGADTSLSVDDPAGQPFITAVGGTQLSVPGPPPAETTWNDDDGDAGGGGISRYATMPAYQLDAAPSVNVIDGDSSGTPCAAPAGEYCREVPDVSASSSADRGYDFYWDGQWGDWYGTSFAAPLWAAFAALADASPACTGIGIGFVNPQLYQLAGTDYGEYFNDITVGNNDANDANGGLYAASVGYDMATGLGSPIGSALAQGLCDAPPDQITFPNPGEQTGTVGVPVSVPLTATDAGGAPIIYTARGLPAGLTVDPTTGAITGTPMNVGTSTVKAVAGDGDGAAATVVFGWSVAAPPAPTTATTPPPTPPPTPTGTGAAPPASTPRALITKVKIVRHTNAVIMFRSAGGKPKAYQCALAKAPTVKKRHRVVAPHPAYGGTCNSPMTYRNLPAARYTFFVHAKGMSGGYSSAATATFTIARPTRRSRRRLVARGTDRSQIRTAARRSPPRRTPARSRRAAR